MNILSMMCSIQIVYGKIKQHYPLTKTVIQAQGSPHGIQRRFGLIYYLSSTILSVKSHGLGQARTKSIMGGWLGPGFEKATYA